MKPLLLALIPVIALVSGAFADTNAEPVVQAQVEAYNAKNIEAFLATYSDDAELFEFPDKLIARGKEQLRERYSARFVEPQLHAEIVKRIVLGDTVVDHERVRRTFPDGPGTLDAIAIYEVRDGKITRAWLRLGEKKLDANAAQPR